MLRQYINLPRPVYILCLGMLINRTGSFLLVFLSLYLSETLGFGKTFATICIGVFGAGGLVSSLLAGHLADRFGRRIVMLVSFFGAPVSLIILSGLETKETILPGIFLFAFLAQSYRPASQAMLADLVPPERRAHAFALMYQAINLGFGMAAVVGGYLAEISFKWLFIGDAVSTAIYGLVILFGIRETLPEKKPEGQGESKPTGGGYLEILGNQVFLVFLVANFLIWGIFQQSLATLPLYVQEFGIGKDSFGKIMAVNGFMIAFTQTVVTHFATRFPRENMMVISALIVGLGFGVFGFSTTTLAFAGGVAIWTLGEMIQSPLGAAIVTDMAPEEQRGRYMGLWGFSIWAAFVVAPPGGGYLLEQYGGEALWFVCAGLGVLAAAIYLILRKKIQVD